MKITRNLRAISKLSLTLLLLVDFIVGAVISYMFAMGYIISLGLQLPKNPAITIANVTFSPQDATTFNVTILNPSYSPSTANIAQIIVITEDGVSQPTAILHPLSMEIKPGNLENFTCSWDWSNYTGETVTVHAFVEGGSGATFEAKTPFMDLRITDVYFNSTVSTTQFNVTIQNSELSATYVNITSITVTLEDETVQEIIEVTPSLPYGLDRGSSETFVCQWDWTDYRSKGLTITALTLQGYRASRDVGTPERVILNIAEATFNVTDTTSFNVTVQNSELSSIHVNITEISVTTQTPEEITIESVDPPLPYSLLPDSQVAFKCLWNWTDFQSQNVTITVYTLQGYTANYTLVTPPWVNLIITEVTFNATDTLHFNVTVENPEFSPTSVNITEITVTVDNETIQITTGVVPELPYMLDINTSMPFSCPWNWTYYRNKTVIIAVQTLQGYAAYYSEFTPLPVNLTITKVVFNIYNMTQFNVTVRNSLFSPAYANVTEITVTLENGTIFEIPGITPQILNPGSSYTFECRWNWTLYRGKSVTVTVHQWQGYPANYSQVTPPPVIITITEALFNVTDTTYFRVTVNNTHFSLTYDVITQITVTMENGTTLEIIEVIPTLPYILDWNDSATFLCSWNWTDYWNKSVTIIVYTLQGYTANYTRFTPPWVDLTITEVIFDAADTNHFNVTIRNSELSPIDVNITRITVTMENGTWLEITDVTPLLPYGLYPNSSVTFVCSWNWTDYRDKKVTITVYALQGYTASYTQTTPTSLGSSSLQSLNVTTQSSDVALCPRRKND